MEEEALVKEYTPEAGDSFNYSEFRNGYVRLVEGRNTYGDTTVIIEHYESQEGLDSGFLVLGVGHSVTKNRGIPVRDIAIVTDSGDIYLKVVDNVSSLDGKAGIVEGPSVQTPTSTKGLSYVVGKRFAKKEFWVLIETDEMAALEPNPVNIFGNDPFLWEVFKANVQAALEAVTQDRLTVVEP
jgi:hypothetical protein